MSVLDRLARKAGNLTAADVEAAVQRAVAEALAGHATAPTAPEATAPQSPRMQALLRAMQTPMPAPERLPSPAPAATANRSEAAVAPRPMPNIPAGEIPVVMHYNELGRVAGFSLGDMEFRISRDANGRILAAANSDGFGTRVTRRDANGRVAGLLVTPPRRR